MRTHPSFPDHCRIRSKRTRTKTTRHQCAGGRAARLSQLPIPPHPPQRAPPRPQLHRRCTYTPVPTLPGPPLLSCPATRKLASLFGSRRCCMSSDLVWRVRTQHTRTRLRLWKRGRRERSMWMLLGLSQRRPLAGSGPWCLLISVPHRRVIPTHTRTLLRHRPVPQCPRHFHPQI